MAAGGGGGTEERGVDCFSCIVVKMSFCFCSIAAILEIMLEIFVALFLVSSPISFANIFKAVIWSLSMFARMGVGGTVGSLLFPGVWLSFLPGVQTVRIIGVWVPTIKLSAHSFRDIRGGDTWLTVSQGIVICAVPSFPL